MKRARCDAADEVLGNADLLKVILLGRIGPTQFCLLRRVNSLVNCIRCPRRLHATHLDGFLP